MSVFVIRAAVLALALFASRPVAAGLFSFQGAFTQDDDRAEFQIALNSTATITMLTWSYGGGTNAQSTVIAPGGFDTVLSLFAGTGPSAAMINLNNDGPAPPLNMDPVTNAAWDAYVQTELPPGLYTLILTQADNLPNGSELGDGFFRDGQGNFTGPTFLGTPGSFVDANPAQRDGHWAVDILNVDAAVLVTAVPESGRISLVASTLLAVGAVVRHIRRRRRQSVCRAL